MRHASGLDRAAFFRDGDRHLTADERAILERLTERRLAREPLAYILGEREFYGLAFIVDRRVLIPRPETETLVDLALAWARRRSSDGYGLTLADIGTGSGCIAVALAVHLPRGRIIATDRSRDALDVALQNAQRHGLLERIDLRRGDLLEPLLDPVDAIVANLPYVAESEAQSLAPEIREHEPRLALFAGPTGLDLQRRLIQTAPTYLRAGGALFMELDPGQAEPLRLLAQQAFPQTIVSLHRDIAGLLRALMVEAAG